ncbi:MAG TPA: cysteine synthase family protein [Actinobacteria bacterium]|nr:cysteine synthase family protein [Actinomycetota bacterium]
MAESILEIIGKTPVVKINKMNPNPNVKIYAKIEGMNPGGSIKDLVAKYMIEKAEESGELTKDKIILEATSGNTGIGLALVSAIKGYKCLIVMPESMTIERRKTLKAYGADLFLTPAEGKMQGAIRKAEELAKDPKYFATHQFANPNNVLAHYEVTGNDILKQVGHVDVFVAGIGTSGTVMGTGKRLKEVNPNVKIVGVEPPVNSKIQGLKCLEEGYVPPIYDESVMTEKVIIKDEDAFKTARELAKKEGIFVGISSGVAMFEAMRQASMMEKGTIVTIFPDSGDKYLSTDLYTES